MKVAIITLNYNGKSDTLALLESLKKLKIENGELKIIVVDNASEDGSVPAIHRAFPVVDILQTGENLGFSGGFNKGIEYAKIWGADYFLLINNDCLVSDQELVSKLVKTAESNIRIGLVSPKIYFEKGFEFHKQSLRSDDLKDRYQKEDLGKVIWFAGGTFNWNHIGNTHRGIDEVDKGKYDDIEHSEIFSGACVLVKKAVFEKLQGLDEKYFLYFEDSDFAKRALDAGFKIYYNGSTSLYHKVSRSTGIGSKITDYYHTRNRLIFGMKYGKFRTKFALIREAIKLLIFGRPAQRRGVLDFYLGITGKGLASHLTSGNVEYPLKLSIGIVNYNTADLTKKLLMSIPHSSDIEIIVLDNGTLDPCKEWISKFHVKYLQNSENEGFSGGYNKTIKYSLGEYYLMLNSDIEVLPKALSELIKTEDEFKGEVVLGGKLVFPDGSPQDSAFHLPTLTGAFNEYFLAKWGSYFMYEPLGDKPVLVEGLAMACFMIPRKVLNRVGLLDEKTFIFFEDIEYCRRLRKLHVPVYFVPLAKFIHHHGASTQKIGLEKSNEHLIKASKYYHGWFYYLLLTFVLRLGQKFGRVKTPTCRWEENIS